MLEVMLLQRTQHHNQAGLTSPRYFVSWRRPIQWGVGAIVSAGYIFLTSSLWYWRNLPGCTKKAILNITKDMQQNDQRKSDPENMPSR